MEKDRPIKMIDINKILNIEMIFLSLLIYNKQKKDKGNK